MTHNLSTFLAVAGEKYSILLPAPLEKMLMLQLKPTEFALFHLTSTVEIQGRTAFVAQNMYTSMNTSEADAVSNFQTECQAAATMHAARRTLKRRRSGFDADAEQLLKQFLFTPHSQTQYI